MAKINSIDNNSGSLTVDPGTSGNSAIKLDINTTTKFRVGVPDGTVDRFYISVGGASWGGAAGFVIEPSGEVRHTVQ